jgi:hypothetical protein
MKINELTTENIPHDGMLWREKISNHHQLGGIETSILVNGAGKGVRISRIDSGSGLRFD